jgi:YesN/AraC family two-component response regulator
LKHDNVLLTDIVMPGIDGFDLVRKMRQISPDTVPILITAYPSVEGMDRAYIDKDIYVHDYIMKPVSRDELCTVVAGAMKKKSI